MILVLFVDPRDVASSVAHEPAVLSEFDERRVIPPSLFVVLAISVVQHEHVVVLVARYSDSFRHRRLQTLDAEFLAAFREHDLPLLVLVHILALFEDCVRFLEGLVAEVPEAFFGARAPRFCRIWA